MIRYYITFTNGERKESRLPLEEGQIVFDGNQSIPVIEEVTGVAINATQGIIEYTTSSIV